jgi:hypothetical protein
MMTQPLTIGAVAGQFGVVAWKVRRLYERDILPPADRIGPYRVIDPVDLPKVAAALHQAGHLGPEDARERRPEVSTHPEASP